MPALRSYEKMQARPPASLHLFWLRFSTASPSVHSCPLLACPAVDEEVNIHIRGNLGTEAQFQHAASAFDAGAGSGVAVAVVGIHPVAIDTALMYRNQPNFSTNSLGDNTSVSLRT